ncbi:SixA phosphatase family protein [Hufsiella arboris]|nr:histidine phosphatase family protein [Hufsiella arboris]
MKQLLLVRHAKSDWDNPDLKDFDKPLNKRGSVNAPEMAERLFKKNIIPQQLVSSPALRAISTAQSFAKIWGVPESDIQQQTSIYEASFTILLNVINNLDGRFDFVALFGHNPGLTNLVAHLSDQGVYNIPTCGVVLLEFDFDSWKYISGSTGQLVLFDYPKNPNI